MSFGLVGTVNNNGWKSPFRHETKYRAGYDKFKYYKTHYRGAKKAGTNDDRWRWTAWFDLDFAHQKIVLIERGELHRQADLKNLTPQQTKLPKPFGVALKKSCYKTSTTSTQRKEYSYGSVNLVLQLLETSDLQTKIVTSLKNLT